MNRKATTGLICLLLAIAMATVPAASAEEGDGGDTCDDSIVIDLSSGGGACDAGDGCDGEDGDTTSGEGGCEGGEACEDSVVVTLQGCNGGTGGDGGDGCNGDPSTQDTIRDPSGVAGHGCKGGDGGDGGGACNGAIIITADGCNAGDGGDGGTGGDGGDCTANDSGCPGGDGGGGGDGGDGGDACSDSPLPVVLVNGGGGTGCTGGDGGCGGPGGDGGKGGYGVYVSGKDGEEGRCVMVEDEQTDDEPNLHFGHKVDSSNPLGLLKQSSSSQSMCMPTQCEDKLPASIFIGPEAFQHPHLLSALEGPHTLSELVAVLQATAADAGLAFNAEVLEAVPTSASSSSTAKPQLESAVDITVELVCEYNPGYAFNGQICGDGTKKGNCDAPVLIFIFSEDQCHSGGSREPGDDEPSCTSQVVIQIGSDGNCQGGPGQAGCEGAIIINDPTSGDVCDAGAGGLLLDLIKEQLGG